MKTKLFRKYYFIIALFLISFAVIGLMARSMVLKLSYETNDQPRPAYIAKLVDQLVPGDRIKSLQMLSREKMQPPVELVLFNHLGERLFLQGRPPFFNWPLQTLPKNDYEFISVENIEPSKSNHLKENILFHSIQDLFQSKPPKTFGHLVKLSGSPDYYLYVVAKRLPPVLGHPVFFYSYLSLLGSVLIGVGLALFFIYRSLKKKMEMADHILTELQNGNLKARFTVGKMDELGMAMSRFNTMADEIEHLVEHLRSVEQSRIVLLQDLAHDLRTPIASLKNLLETAELQKDNLKGELREEILALSLKEVDYFERLVEDLLFLAGMSEPRYKSDQKNVDLQKLVKEIVAMQFESKKISIDLSQCPNQFLGDEFLLKRLIRNTLMNAFSFATHEVQITASIQQKDLILSISDDGPGFTVDELQSFGLRKMTRVVHHGKEKGRVSVGLGSVIMKTVAKLHGGSVDASNNAHGGAIITIKLPLRSEGEIS